jgi:hypothetical protein
MLIKTSAKSINIIDILLFILLVAISLMITFFYISKERYIYYWDYSRSSSQINELVLSFQKSLFEGIGLIIISLFDDYTQLPSLPLLPFRMILGNSRISFIYSLVLAYIVPFCLMMGGMLTKVILTNTRAIFWSTSFFTLLIPAVWISIFRGFPDIGGSTLISLAMLTYWQDFNLKEPRQRYFIAFIFAITVLFRRHFIYSFRAFIIAVIIYKIIEYITQHKINLSRSLRYLKIFCFRVIHVLILFTSFAFIIIIKALLINYRVLYASYETSVESNVQYYTQSFGVILLLPSIAGFLLSSFNPLIDRRKLFFFVLFAFVTIFQWFFFAKQINVQYTTHFLPFIVTGSYLFIWGLLKKSIKFLSIIFAVLSLFGFVFNIFLSLTSYFRFPSSIFYVFSKQDLPLFREDYLTVKSLVKYLREVGSSEKKIYVAASSYSLNYSVFTTSEQQNFGKSILPISRNSNIDSRDFYPLNGLLQAHYVVVALPYQYHIEPKEQTVVRVVVDAFNQNWTIAQDFTLLSQTFKLEHGITVQIYERIRPTSFPTILETLAKMRSQVSRIPGQEPYWLDLKSEQPSAIIQDPLLKMVQVLRLQITNKRPTALLYFGKIPKQAKVTGLYSITKCPSTSDPISLQISTLDKNGTVLTQTKKLYSKSELAPFELKISGQSANFIRLSLMIDSDKKSLITSCRAELNLLKVSQQ